MEIKIAIAYHKPSLILKHDNFLPIHVGKSLHPEIELDIQPDNEGDNISDQNGYFCELTATYWLWKNCKADIKGLMHYRRIFHTSMGVKENVKNHYEYLRKKSKKKSYIANNLYSVSEFEEIARHLADDVSELMTKYDIIVSDNSYLYPNVEYGFAIIDMEYIKILKDAVKNTFPEYYDTLASTLKGRRLHYANMVIMQSELYDRYCEFLFGSLEAVKDILINEKYLIDLKTEKIFSRKLGYLAEILTSVFVNHQRDKNCLKVKEYPVAILEPIL